MKVESKAVINHKMHASTAAGEPTTRHLPLKNEFVAAAPLGMTGLEFVS